MYTPEQELVFKNNGKFAHRFHMGVCCIGNAEWQKQLLKEEFEMKYPGLDFDEEYKKVSYE